MTTLLIAMALAACGGEKTPDKPKGAGVALPDMSKIGKTEGAKPDAAVIRDRRVLGTWRGTVGGSQAELSIGAKGSATIRTTRNGSVTDVASGSWTWAPDGTLQGTFTGGRTELSGFARWAAAFPSADRISMTGSGTTTGDFGRTGSRGARTPEEANRIYQQEMEHRKVRP